MTKKLTAPRLPDNPTEEEKEAFRLSVSESMKDILNVTPQEANQFLADVLRQLIANGMRPIDGTLPEGITTEPIKPYGIDRLTKILKRKRGVVRVEGGIMRIVVDDQDQQ